LINWIGIGEAIAQPQQTSLLEKIKNHAADSWKIGIREQAG
jgi:hypothetical protein